MSDESLLPVEHCNVCGRELVRRDERAIGMCAICANEEEPEPPRTPEQRKETMR